MARLQSITSIAAAVVLFLAMSACAQDSPATPAAPVNCTAAVSIAFNPAQLAGQWYEVARNPAPPTTMSCIGVNMLVIGNNNIMQINVTYANDNKFLYVNETITANISLANAGTASNAGVNITYTIGQTSFPITTYKLLATDYNNYAFVCGFTNSSNNATEFGLVLTRDRGANGTLLQGYEQSAAANFSNFLNGSMSKITQTSDCYNAGAATTLPFLASIMAVIYMLLKMVY